MFDTNLVVLLNCQRYRQQMRSKALQPEMTEQSDAAEVDIVAKKRELMSELASTLAESQVLERDNERLRKDIVTAGMTYVHFTSSSSSSVLLSLKMYRLEWRYCEDVAKTVHSQRDKYVVDVDVLILKANLT